MFMIAAACKDTVCVVERGSPLGLTVRLRPPPCSSPTVSSLMFAPQMMAGIIMNRMTAQIWAGTVTTEKIQLASPL